jgi:arylsulfatase A-like enzyme
MAVSRRKILKTAAALGGAATVRGRARDRKPNLLFLIADDHARYVLRCEGNRKAATPSLDQLAAEGVRFGRHYCNSPVCTPSRQSILTGQLPHAAGVTVLGTPLSEDKPTLAKQLAGHGYETAVFGKMHFNRPGRPGLHGFQTAVTEDVVHTLWTAAGAKQPVPDIATKPPWHPFKDPARIWLNADKLPFARYYDEMRSTWTARQACQFLDEHKEGRFALWVSLFDPHSPFDFPVEDRNAFDQKTFEVPQPGPNDAGQIPLIFRSLSRQDKQGIIAAYYTSVRYLDHNMGMVLRKLRELNLERDTLVLYMADHGYSLGQHGRFEKHCCYEPAVVAPLIFRWPGRIRPGVVHDFTESVDVPHTILDMLSIEAFTVRHGQSLRPYLEGGRPKAPRASSFNEYLENEEACVRTERWKFIQCSGRRARTDGYITDNPTPGRYVRLFDEAKDPDELFDVSVRHPDVVTELSTTMLERFRATHPEASLEPKNLATAELLDWYLRPRDAKSSG